MTPRALITPRLRLEPPSERHLDALVDIHRRNTQQFAGKMVKLVTRNADAARWLIAPQRGERYVIVHKKLPIGMVSLTNLCEFPFSNGTLGYWLDDAQGKQGFAREAVARVVKHAFTKLALHRVEANIAPDNMRSIKLVKKLGFRLEGVSPRMLYLDGAWRDQKRFALTVEEWSPQ